MNIIIISHISDHGFQKYILFNPCGFATNTSLFPPGTMRAGLAPSPDIIVTFKRVWPVAASTAMKYFLISVVDTVQDSSVKCILYYVTIIVIYTVLYIVQYYYYYNTTITPTTTTTSYLHEHSSNLSNLRQIAQSSRGLQT